jgi:hypothetical protein
VGWDKCRWGGTTQAAARPQHLMVAIMPPAPLAQDGDVNIVVGKNFESVVLDTTKDVLLEVGSCLVGSGLQSMAAQSPPWSGVLSASCFTSSSRSHQAAGPAP